MGGTFGETIKMTIFGESHGESVGLVIDGLPPGVELNMGMVESEMKRRRPGKNLLSTQRQETDSFVVQSGFFEGRTTGTPLCVIIPNRDSHSGDYALLQSSMRPGHADYAGRIRYNGYNDYRGGGHFSGRLTAPLVLMGAIAQQLLAVKSIILGAHIAGVGEIKDQCFSPLGESRETLAALKTMMVPVLDGEKGKLMEHCILEARADGDSVGGIIECIITGLPAGLGNPFFDSVESRLSHALFSIPAVKGVEFGDGFGFAAMKGSDANDEFYFEDDVVKTKTNHNGGINGGITNGMPLLFKVALKPTSSISKPQHTVNMDQRENTTLEIKGRHDPCIVQRAVPVVEAVAAWTLLDVLMTTGKQVVW